jgi:predicted SPOUT superfamily RNA methylase MTH1
MSKSAFVEYRPLASNPHTPVTHHVVIVDHQVVHQSKLQVEAATWAQQRGYTVHVARERHLQDKAQPAHWRHF